MPSKTDIVESYFVQLKVNLTFCTSQKMRVFYQKNPKLFYSKVNVVFIQYIFGKHKVRKNRFSCAMFKSLSKVLM